MTIPIAPIAGLLGMPAMGLIITDVQTGAWQNVGPHAAQMVGVTSAGVFDYNLMLKNVTPLIAGMAVHKIAGIVGVNRALASAKVPWVRI